MGKLRITACSLSRAEIVDRGTLPLQPAKPRNRVPDRTPFLEVLPSGEKVGRLPGFFETDQLRLLGHPESPISAIRAKCVDCCGGSPGEVRKCTAVSCPLWPMRMGRNPFYGQSHAKRVIEEEPEADT